MKAVLYWTVIEIKQPLLDQLQLFIFIGTFHHLLFVLPLLILF